MIVNKKNDIFFFRASIIFSEISKQQKAYSLKPHKTIHETDVNVDANTFEIC